MDPCKPKGESLASSSAWSMPSKGRTIAIVEQNVHSALSVASRAYVFETGRVVAESTAANILGSPDLLRAYLGG